MIECGSRLRAQGTTGTTVMVIRPFSFRTIHRSHLKNNRVKVASALERQLKTVFLAHFSKSFKIQFFTSEQSSKENEVYLKPVTESFKANTERILGFVINEQLVHFSHNFEIDQKPISAEGCLSLHKITSFPIKDRVLVYFNRR